MSKVVPKFYGNIKNGVLEYESPVQVQVYLDSLVNQIDEAARVSIVIKKWHKNRSNRQNSYYHGVVVKILSDEIGYTPEEMHDALRLKFLGKEHRELPTVRSTTDLSTVEFEEYLSRVREWASTEGIYIPLPNEVDFQDYI